MYSTEFAGLFLVTRVLNNDENYSRLLEPVTF